MNFWIGWDRWEDSPFISFLDLALTLCNLRLSSHPSLSPFPSQEEVQLPYVPLELRSLYRRVLAGDEGLVPGLRDIPVAWGR